MFKKDPLKKWKTKKKNNKLIFLIGSIIIFILLYYLLFIGNKDNLYYYTENNFLIKSNFLINNEIILTPKQEITGEIELSIENKNNINYVVKAYLLVNNEYLLNDNQDVLISYSNLYDETSGTINNMDSKIIKLNIDNKTELVQKIKLEILDITNKLDKTNITNIYYEGDIEFKTYIDGNLSDNFPNNANYTPSIICKSNNEIIDLEANIYWNENQWEVSINDVYYFNLNCEIIFVAINK